MESNVVSKTTLLVVLLTVTEEFCEMLQKIKSKTSSKIQERLPSGPPNNNQTNTYFFSGGFAVKGSLWYEQKNAILDESLRWRFLLYEILIDTP